MWVQSRIWCCITNEAVSHVHLICELRALLLQFRRRIHRLGSQSARPRRSIRSTRQSRRGVHRIRRQSGMQQSPQRKPRTPRQLSQRRRARERTEAAAHIREQPFRVFESALRLNQSRGRRAGNSIWSRPARDTDSYAAGGRRLSDCGDGKYLAGCPLQLLDLSATIWSESL